MLAIDERGKLCFKLRALIPSPVVNSSGFKNSCDRVYFILRKGTATAQMDVYGRPIRRRSLVEPELKQRNS